MYRVRTKYFESWIKRNGTGDLDCRGVICLFMRVSITRGSCAKADFLAIILGPRLGTLRVIGIYYTLEVHLLASLRSSGNRKCRYSPSGSSRFWSSGHHRIPRRRLSQRVRSEWCLKPPRVPVIKDVGRNVLSRFSSMKLNLNTTSKILSQCAREICLRTLRQCCLY